jgi:hypothetical protein
VLEKSGLMASPGYAIISIRFYLAHGALDVVRAGAPARITSAGFQFLLQSPHEQLWEILLQYLRMAEVRVLGRILRLLISFTCRKWTLLKFLASYS